MSNPLVKPKRAIQRGSNPLRRPARQVRKTSSSLNNGSNSTAALSKFPVDSSTATPSTMPSKANGIKKLKSKPGNATGSTSNNTNTITAEYKLHACTADDIRDLRYHIMRFHTPSRKPVDPVKHFTKPIRLHRKDPRNMQNQLTLAEIEERNKRMGITAPIPKSVLQEAMLAEAKQAETAAENNTNSGAASLSGTAANGADASNKEVPGATNGSSKDDGANQKKAAPEADMSLIAPDGGARRNKANLFQKKTKQVIMGDPNARRIRYEEFYPWVMEDFDGQNTWVGNFEAGQMSQYVLFVFDKDGFKMVPAERWYKMTPRNKYATLTLEEVEKHMDSREQPDRWVMKYFGQDEDDQQKRPLNARRRFRATDTARDDEDGARKDDDGNEIDFDDEFADDEEAPIMDGNEEDVKEVERKIKKEQQVAKFTNLFDEPVDEEGDEQKVDKQGRNIIKSLRSLEKNNYYSDDDSNPYASEESSDDEEDLDAATGLGAGKDANGIKKEGDAETEAGAQGSQALPGATTGGTALDERLRREKKLKDKKAKKDKKKKNAKRHHDLPRGMVILSLPSSRLAQFPENLWNPSLKRRRADSDTEETVAGDSNAAMRGPKSKKIKIKVSKEDGVVPTPIGENAANVDRDSPALSRPIAMLSLSANTPERASSTASSGDIGTPTPSGSTLSKNMAKPPTSRPQSQSLQSPAGPAEGSSPLTEPNPNLLREEEITNIIRNRRLTAKELLAELKHRIHKDPENLKRLKRFAKKVAMLHHDGYLVLRENK